MENPSESDPKKTVLHLLILQNIDYLYKQKNMIKTILLGKFSFRKWSRETNERMNNYNKNENENEN